MGARPELGDRAWEAQERREEQAQRQIRRDIGRAAAERADEPAREQTHDREQEQERLRIRVLASSARTLRGLTGDEARRVMAEAVFTVQTTMTTWTRADLIRHLGEALPATAMADRGTLERLAAVVNHPCSGERRCAKPPDPGDAIRPADWVKEVYRPVYGYLADLLAPCWRRHPLCLAYLDILHEAWCLLYLGQRDPKLVFAQLDWLTRSLLQTAEVMANETRRCRDLSRHCEPGQDATPFPAAPRLNARR